MTQEATIWVRRHQGGVVRQEHAPPLARASVETGVEFHTAGDVVYKAASGGCCVSSSWAS